MLDEAQIAAVTEDTAEKIKAKADRRSLLRRAGLGIAGVAAAGALTSKPASAQTITDAVIFNFALNFEYLGAEYYLRGVTGNGLSNYSAVTGTGTQGTVTGGSLVPFKTTALAYYAQQLANDELAHVLTVREVLGSAAIAEPTIDLVNSWTTLATAAGLVPCRTDLQPVRGRSVLPPRCLCSRGCLRHGPCRCRCTADRPDQYRLCRWLPGRRGLSGRSNPRVPFRYRCRRRH